MPIKRKDRISGESKLSRIMQQKVPRPTTEIAEQIRDDIVESADPAELIPGAFGISSADAEATVEAAEATADVDPDNTGFFFTSNTDSDGKKKSG